MRSHIIISLLLVLCAIFSSCQKEFEDSNNAPINTTVDFKAKINGVQFIAAISGAVRRGSDSVISISGKSNDGQIIAFTLADSGVHVYTLGINSTVNFCGYEDNNGLAFSSNEGINPGDSGGNIAIISIDSVKKLMSGTFNLKVFRQIDRTQRIITEGIFNNISY